jgi:hypothetical protein
MEQRDYLLKQVEHLGQVLGKILSKLLDIRKRCTVNIIAVSRIFSEEIDFSIEKLYGIENYNLINVLKDEMNLDIKNLEKLADIFLIVAESINNNEDKKFYQMGLIIFQYIEKTESTYSFERNQKINKIQAQLNNSSER